MIADRESLLASVDNPAPSYPVIDGMPTVPGPSYVGELSDRDTQPSRYLPAFDALSDKQLEAHLYSICNAAYARFGDKPECLSGTLMLGEKMFWSAECLPPEPESSESAARRGETNKLMERI